MGINKKARMKVGMNGGDLRHKCSACISWQLVFQQFGLFREIFFAHTITWHLLSTLHIASPIA
jgi:hypothetical protein